MSVRSQSYRPIELIVVDNHSCHMTVEIARQRADIVAIAGPREECSKGIIARASDRVGYLLFVDSARWRRVFLSLKTPETIAAVSRVARAQACDVSQAWHPRTS